MELKTMRLSCNVAHALRILHKYATTIIGRKPGIGNSRYEQVVPALFKNLPCTCA